MSDWQFHNPFLAYEIPPSCSFLCFALTSDVIAAPQPVKGRTIEDINVIPTRVLKRAISPKFFETLRISPIDGHVVVRAQLVGTKLFGARDREV